jgi:hypothetical protein
MGFLDWIKAGAASPRVVATGSDEAKHERSVPCLLGDGAANSRAW